MSRKTPFFQVDMLFDSLSFFPKWIIFDALNKTIFNAFFPGYSRHRISKPILYLRKLEHFKIMGIHVILVMAC